MQRFAINLQRIICSMTFLPNWYCSYICFSFSLKLEIRNTPPRFTKKFTKNQDPRIHRIVKEINHLNQTSSQTFSSNNANELPRITFLRAVKKKKINFPIIISQSRRSICLSRIFEFHIPRSTSPCIYIYICDPGSSGGRPLYYA